MPPTDSSRKRQTVVDRLNFKAVSNLEQVAMIQEGQGAATEESVSMLNEIEEYLYAPPLASGFLERETSVQSASEADSTAERWWCQLKGPFLMQWKDYHGSLEQDSNGEFRSEENAACQAIFLNGEFKPISPDAKRHLSGSTFEYNSGKDTWDQYSTSSGSITSSWSRVDVEALKATKAAARKSVSRGTHIVFVLDESGSMGSSWGQLESAYKEYLGKYAGSSSDIFSLIQFDDSVRTIYKKKKIGDSVVSKSLEQKGGTTNFTPAMQEAQRVINGAGESLKVKLLFMSDGSADDGYSDACTIIRELKSKLKENFEVHTVAFGSGADQTSLREMAKAAVSSGEGNFHAASSSASNSGNSSSLVATFSKIAEASSENLKALNYDILSPNKWEVKRKVDENLERKIGSTYHIPKDTGKRPLPIGTKIEIKRNGEYEPFGTVHHVYFDFSEPTWRCTMPEAVVDLRLMDYADKKEKQDPEADYKEDPEGDGTTEGVFFMYSFNNNKSRFRKLQGDERPCKVQKDESDECSVDNWVEKIQLVVKNLKIAFLDDGSSSSQINTLGNPLLPRPVYRPYSLAPRNLKKKLNTIKVTVELPNELLRPDRTGGRHVWEKMRKLSASPNNGATFEDNENKIKAAFKELDEDNSGELEEVELSKLCKQLGTEVNPRDMMKEMDTDKNGRISVEEFTEWWKSLLPERCVTLEWGADSQTLKKGSRRASKATGTRTSAVKAPEKRTSEVDSTAKPESNNKNSSWFSGASLLKNKFQRVKDKEAVEAAAEAAEAALATETKGRTIVFLDCTGSMSGTIAAAKSAISDMIQRAAEFCEPKGLTFEVQVCAYRNYDCKVDQIFQQSGWETDPAPLLAFIETLTAHGGSSIPEAVELCLEHIVVSHTDQNPVSQAIIVADASAQPHEMTDEKREKGGGSSKFQGTRLENPVYRDEQLELVVDAGVPVYAVWLQEEARQSFEHIGKVTGGDDRRLDINGADAVSTLTHIVTQNILKSAAGSDKKVAKKLLDEYAEKYGGREVADEVLSMAVTPTAVTEEPSEDEAEQESNDQKSSWCSDVSLLLKRGPAAEGLTYKDVKDELISRLLDVSTSRDFQVVEHDGKTAPHVGWTYSRDIQKMPVPHDSLVLCDKRSGRVLQDSAPVDLSSVKERKAVKAKFREVDADRSGALDMDELAELCKKLGAYVTPAELRAEMLSEDEDGKKKKDANITFKVFYEWWQKTADVVLRLDARGVFLLMHLLDLDWKNYYVRELADMLHDQRHETNVKALLAIAVQQPGIREVMENRLTEWWAERIDRMVEDKNAARMEEDKRQLEAEEAEKRAEVEEAKLAAQKAASKKTPVKKTLSKKYVSKKTLAISGTHTIFVLDESGSMSSYWTELQVAYREYLDKYKGSKRDIFSLVQFQNRARTVYENKKLDEVNNNHMMLTQESGGTSFTPAMQETQRVVNNADESLKVKVLFMSDGSADDGHSNACQIIREMKDKLKEKFEIYTVAFGSGADQTSLKAMAEAGASSGEGNFLASSSNKDSAPSTTSGESNSPPRGQESLSAAFSKIAEEASDPLLSLDRETIRSRIKKMDNYSLAAACPLTLPAYLPSSSASSQSKPPQRLLGDEMTDPYGSVLWILPRPTTDTHGVDRTLWEDMVPEVIATALLGMLPEHGQNDRRIPRKIRNMTRVEIKMLILEEVTYACKDSDTKDALLDSVTHSNAGLMFATILGDTESTKQKWNCNPFARSRGVAGDSDDEKSNSSEENDDDTIGSHRSRLETLVALFVPALNDYICDMVPFQLQLKKKKDIQDCKKAVKARLRSKPLTYEEFVMVLNDPTQVITILSEDIRGYLDKFAAVVICNTVSASMPEDLADAMGDYAIEARDASILEDALGHVATKHILLILKEPTHAVGCIVEPLKRSSAGVEMLEKFISLATCLFIDGIGLLKLTEEGELSEYIVREDVITIACEIAAFVVATSSDPCDIEDGDFSGEQENPALGGANSSVAADSYNADVEEGRTSSGSTAGGNTKFEADTDKEDAEYRKKSKKDSPFTLMLKNPFRFLRFLYSKKDEKKPKKGAYKKRPNIEGLTVTATKIHLIGAALITDKMKRYFGVDDFHATGGDPTAEIIESLCRLMGGSKEESKFKKNLKRMSVNTKAFKERLTTEVDEQFDELKKKGELETFKFEECLSLGPGMFLDLLKKLCTVMFETLKKLLVPKFGIKMQKIFHFQNETKEALCIFLKRMKLDDLVKAIKLVVVASTGFGAAAVPQLIANFIFTTYNKEIAFLLQRPLTELIIRVARPLLRWRPEDCLPPDGDDHDVKKFVESEVEPQKGSDFNFEGKKEDVSGAQNEGGGEEQKDSGGEDASINESSMCGSCFKSYTKEHSTPGNGNRAGNSYKPENAEDNDGDDRDDRDDRDAKKNDGGVKYAMISLYLKAGLEPAIKFIGMCLDVPPNLLELIFFVTTKLMEAILKNETLMRKLKIDKNKAKQIMKRSANAAKAAAIRSARSQLLLSRSAAAKMADTLRAMPALQLVEDVSTAMERQSSVIGGATQSVALFVAATPLKYDETVKTAVASFNTREFQRLAMLPALPTFSVGIPKIPPLHVPHVGSTAPLTMLLKRQGLTAMGKSVAVGSKPTLGKDAVWWRMGVVLVVICFLSFIWLMDMVMMCSWFKPDFMAAFRDDLCAEDANWYIPLVEMLLAIGFLGLIVNWEMIGRLKSDEENTEDNKILARSPSKLMIDGGAPSLSTGDDGADVESVALQLPSIRFSGCGVPSALSCCSWRRIGFYAPKFWTVCYVFITGTIGGVLVAQKWSSDDDVSDWSWWLIWASTSPPVAITGSYLTPIGGKASKLVLRGNYFYRVTIFSYTGAAIALGLIFLVVKISGDDVERDLSWWAVISPLVVAALPIATAASIGGAVLISRLSYRKLRTGAKMCVRMISMEEADADDLEEEPQSSLDPRKAMLVYFGSSLVAFIVMLALKLTSKSDWSLWVVFSPVLGAFGLIIMLLVTAAVSFAIYRICGKIKDAIIWFYKLTREEKLKWVMWTMFCLPATALILWFWGYSMTCFYDDFSTDFDDYSVDVLCGTGASWFMPTIVVSYFYTISGFFKLLDTIDIEDDDNAKDMDGLLTESPDTDDASTSSEGAIASTEREGRSSLALGDTPKDENEDESEGDWDEDDEDLQTESAFALEATINEHTEESQTESALASEATSNEHTGDGIYEIFLKAFKECWKKTGIERATVRTVALYEASASFLVLLLLKSMSHGLPWSIVCVPLAGATALLLGAGLLVAFFAWAREWRRHPTNKWHWATAFYILAIFIFVVFVTLKSAAAGSVADWSWALVCSPLVISIAITVYFAIFVAAVKLLDNFNEGSKFASVSGLYFLVALAIFVAFFVVNLLSTVATFESWLVVFSPLLVAVGTYVVVVIIIASVVAVYFLLLKYKDNQKAQAAIIYSVAAIVVFVAFLILKAAAVSSFTSWWVVTSPLLGAVGAPVMVITLIVLGVGAFYLGVWCDARMGDCRKCLASNKEAYAEKMREAKEERRMEVLRFYVLKEQTEKVELKKIFQRRLSSSQPEQFKKFIAVLPSRRSPGASGEKRTWGKNFKFLDDKMRRTLCIENGLGNDINAVAFWSLVTLKQKEKLLKKYYFEVPTIADRLEKNPLYSTAPAAEEEAETELMGVDPPQHTARAQDIELPPLRGGPALRGPALRDDASLRSGPALFEASNREESDDDNEEKLDSDNEQEKLDSDDDSDEDTEDFFYEFPERIAEYPATIAVVPNTMLSGERPLTEAEKLSIRQYFNGFIKASNMTFITKTIWEREQKKKVRENVLLQHYYEYSFEAACERCFTNTHASISKQDFDESEIEVENVYRLKNGVSTRSPLPDAVIVLRGKQLKRMDMNDRRALCEQLKVDINLEVAFWTISMRNDDLGGGEFTSTLMRFYREDRMDLIALGECMSSLGFVSHDDGAFGRHGVQRASMYEVNAADLGSLQSRRDLEKHADMTFDMCGYLEKQSSTTLKWEKRWFELTGPWLQYWPSHKHEKKTYAAIDMRLLAAAELESNDTLIHSQMILSSKTGREVRLRATTVRDAGKISDWKDKIQQVLELWASGSKMVRRTLGDFPSPSVHTVSPDDDSKALVEHFRARERSYLGNAFETLIAISLEKGGDQLFVNDKRSSTKANGLEFAWRQALDDFKKHKKDRIGKNWKKALAGGQMKARQAKMKAHQAMLNWDKVRMHAYGHEDSVGRKKVREIRTKRKAHFMMEWLKTELRHEDELTKENIALRRATQKKTPRKTGAFFKSSGMQNAGDEELSVPTREYLSIASRAPMDIPESALPAPSGLRRVQLKEPEASLDSGKLGQPQGRMKVDDDKESGTFDRQSKDWRDSFVAHKAPKGDAMIGCSHYREDPDAATPGTCLCGQPRSAHGKHAFANLLRSNNAQTGAGQTLYSGFLEKKGGGTRIIGRRQWSKRWFVVHANVLTYYKNEGGKIAGQLQLEGCRLVDVQESTKGHHHLDIHARTGRVLEIRSSDESQLAEFKQVLLEALASHS